MLNTIIGTFIGGWLVCSIVAATMSIDHTNEVCRKENRGLFYKMFALFCFFLTGPILIGAALSDLQSKIEKPSH